MGGPTSAIIIANVVLQLVGVVKGRSQFRSLMSPAEPHQEEGGLETVKQRRKGYLMKTVSLFSTHLL